MLTACQCESNRRLSSFSSSYWISPDEFNDIHVCTKSNWEEKIQTRVVTISSILNTGAVTRCLFDFSKMSKNSCEVTSRLVLTLFIGIFLGSSLSSLFFYPQKISNILQTTKPSFRFREKLITRLSDGYSESLADKLYRNVRVLCWVLTMPENHKTKAIHVKNTWGKRCNKLLFMSTATDFEIDSIALPVEDGRNSLWDKTRLAFHHVYNYHFNDYDYFLKADDDS